MSIFRTGNIVELQSFLGDTPEKTGTFVKYITRSDVLDIAIVEFNGVEEQVDAGCLKLIKNTKSAVQHKLPKETLVYGDYPY